MLLAAATARSRPGRNYYTELVEQTPADSVVLTVATVSSASTTDLGTIGNPRILLSGRWSVQNDAGYAVQIATALCNAFDCGVNDLPLSFCSVLVRQRQLCPSDPLLHLGIKNIAWDQLLPAFITLTSLTFLLRTNSIGPIGDASRILPQMLAHWRETPVLLSSLKRLLAMRWERFLL